MSAMSNSRLLAAHLAADGADRISRPLLVVHGRNDPRVPRCNPTSSQTGYGASGGRCGFSRQATKGRFGKQQNLDAYYHTFAEFSARAAA